MALTEVGPRLVQLPRIESLLEILPVMDETRSLAAVVPGVSGIWVYDIAKSKWTKINPNTPIGAITAGDFNGDGKADVASTWRTGLWWQDVAAGRHYRVSQFKPVSFNCRRHYGGRCGGDH